LGLAACQKGLSVGFTTAASLVHELMEARDEKRLLRFQKQLASYRLLIIDELGFVLLSKTGAELLFEVFSLRYERGSVLVTSNLPFDEWTEVFGSERLTGALLDRLTHHVHILEMNGESYRLSQSKSKIPRLVGGWYTFAPPNWPTFSPAFTASAVGVGDTLRLCDTKGRTRVFSLDGTALAENDLRELTCASFAPVDGWLFVRTKSRLYCIGR
jgi:hypothetical protein